MASLKKKEKTKVDNSNAEDSGEGIGSKILLAFVTLLIIIIWLGIIVLLIKLDVGGFGSTVLRPIIKDVPYLNVILPEEEENIGEEYQFETIEDAIARIKELEAMLDAQYAKGDVDAATILELQNTIAALSVYKEEQDEFEIIKQKWYEEVIFGTENVDYEWYKVFYESIDPENAEALYKEVIRQYVYDKSVKDFVATYSTMQPKAAAAIFDNMVKDGKTKLACDILINMDTQSRADIMAKMNSENAAKLTVLMEPKK
ncbi:MAG: MotE family protein [Agathobacter sp.]